MPAQWLLLAAQSLLLLLGCLSVDAHSFKTCTKADHVRVPLARNRRSFRQVALIYRNR
ncbi:hypothetical protein EMIHUDRAFT_316681 [Emiliania huxleyi CCMP1516]|uniref:Uncharacterized protein n=2 Tax=Emiliania huxleyi TaxID=2903 RepID=A0A0D3IUT1_EMIH1|nr:hypothetical protein EMIHUDRAFT_316681 [Emiliania huxleyi CCMP1516]EOD15016.1 hypothetical protein EMIHUDRAFT_316681 [Emiliania huxleyi CCMP1516]|eukprot:XP_005767445.1 hypothetical protein EMIHUDRAFT_316681 [Emiliania huxleyi CCMP1516]